MSRLILSQIYRSTKRKNDITSYLRTCYVVISCGGRIAYKLTGFCFKMATGVTLRPFEAQATGQVVGRAALLR